MGTFRTVYLYSIVTGNQGCKSLSGEFNVQNIEHGPVYRACFALYIKLELMKARVFVLAVAVSVPLCAAAAKPSEVVTFANARGEKEALAQFFPCDNSGDEAYAGVSSGSRQWLAIAVRLLPHADACYSEFLHDAVARAIVPAAPRVLALVGSSPQLTASQICIPFLSAEEPASEHLAYLSKAEHALRRVNARELQPAKQACLAEIASTRRIIRQ
jgi:hypothetical protein